MIKKFFTILIFVKRYSFKNTILQWTNQWPAWYLLVEFVKNLWIAVSVVACPMSVLKIQKQSPWRVLWKGVPKNYPKFIGSYRLEACNFIKKTPTRTYFRHLLRAVLAHNALFQCVLFYSYRTDAHPF